MTLPALIAGILAALNYFKVIVSGGRGKNGATVANTSVLFPAFPVAFVQVILFAEIIIAKNYDTFILTCFHTDILSCRHAFMPTCLDTDMLSY